MSNNKKQERRELMQALSFMSHIGLTIVSCVFIGVLIGRVLDHFLNTSPWFLLLFSLLGVAAAIREIARNGDNM